jgi:hypothetical protein
VLVPLIRHRLKRGRVEARHDCEAVPRLRQTTSPGR